MPGEAGVEQRHVSAGRDEQVARLDVAVAPARRGQGAERLGRLPRDPQRHGHVRPPARRQPVPKRPPFEPRHHQVVRRLPQARGQHRNQVRMRDAAAHLDLAAKRLDRPRLRPPVPAEDFTA